MRKRLLIIVLILALAGVSGGVGVWYLWQENRVFDGVSLIYKGIQYLATYTQEPVQVAFLLITQDSCSAQSSNDLSSVELFSPGGARVEIDDYSIESLKNPSLWSGYALCKIHGSFTPNLPVGRTETFTHLQVDGKEYEIGSVTVEVVNNNDYRLGRGSSSLHVENSYNLTVINDEDTPIDVVSVVYVLDMKQTNLMDQPVTVQPGEEKELFFSVPGFHEKNVTVRPVITLRVQGEEVALLPPVATEYTMSLSKEEVIDYIEKTGS